jgi:putative endonuclease
MPVVRRSYSTYILASHSRTLYIRVTNDLVRRMRQHKEGLHTGFAARYRVNRLVYYETFGDIRCAIAREKELKGWLRLRKIELIESTNPAWDDLAAAWA